MALREIGARLTLEGEAEWNREMKAADRELKNLKSALAASSAEFSGQANTLEALRAKQAIQQQQTEQQREKVEALSRAVEEAAALWGEDAAQVDKYTQQLNYARASLANMERGLEETNGYLEEAEDAADGCATSIDGLGKKAKQVEAPVKKAGDAVEELGDEAEEASGAAGILQGAVEKLIPQLGQLKNASALTAAGIGAGVAGALIGAYKWAENLVESTAELRQQLTELEISASAAGLHMDEDMTRAMKVVYEASGDIGTALKTVSDLMMADYSGTGMAEVLEELRGAVIAFPDTLKIDSLAEGLQKTLSTGAADGQFKDMLERLGVDVGTLEAELAACTTAAQRQNTVMQTLARSGLREMTEEYREASEASVALSDANFDLEMANARLAESLEPVAARITEARAGLAESLANLADAHNLGGNFFSVMTAGFSSGIAAGEQRGLSMEELFDTVRKSGKTFESIYGDAARAGKSIGQYLNELHAAQVETERVQAEADAAVAEQEQAAAERHQAALDALGETKDVVADAVAQLGELQAVYEQIRTNIDSVASGFTDLSDAAEQYATTTPDMIAALQSQIDYMADYTANLQAAKDMGLSDALVEELSDGSAQSAAYLAAIVEDGGESIQELNAKFAEVESGKQAFVDTVAEALPGFTETIDAITTTLDAAVGDWNKNEAAKGAALSTVGGLKAGLSGHYDELFALGASLGDAVMDGYNAAMDIHSPSHRMERAMGFTVAGAVNEGERQMGTMRALGEGFADAVMDGYDRGSLGVRTDDWRYTPRTTELAAAQVAAAPAAGSGAVAGEVAAMRGTLSSIAGALRAGIPVVLDDGTVVGRLTRQIDRALGESYL